MGPIYDRLPSSKGGLWLGPLPEIGGNWVVTNVKEPSIGVTGRETINIDTGDKIAFHLDTGTYDETLMFNLQRADPAWGDPEFEVESIAVDEEKNKVKLFTSDMEFKYVLRDDKLILSLLDSRIRLYLERA